MGDLQSTMRTSYPETNFLKTGSDDNVDHLGSPRSFLANLFTPSRCLTVVGFIPVVGNAANLGAAVHAYQHGETWYGHQKLLETAVGVSVDLAIMGSAKEGWKLAQLGVNNGNVACAWAGSRILVSDLAQHTATRMSALGAVQYFMNPPYKKY